jgi:hypothetical protein
MKIFKYLIALTILAIVIVQISGCFETTDENCEQQDMNQILDCGVEKNVEVCCESGADCVYKYNGQSYEDSTSGLNDLADALGCDYKSSADMSEQKELIIKSLKALRHKAWLGTVE